MRKIHQKYRFLFMVFGCVSVVLCTSFINLIHPYFVGVTEIRMDSKNKSIKVSCKLFTDDLQQTLHKVYKTKVDLKANDSASDNMINDYFKAHLKITSGAQINLRYIGYEIEEEACWSYFEGVFKTQPDKIEVTNTLLYNEISTQTNLIHCYVDGKRKSYKLVNPSDKAVFDFP